MRHHLQNDIQRWTDDLSSGITTHDGDFKHLTDLINQLNYAISNDRGNAALGRILDELLKYMLLHFDDEELLMRQIAYTDYSTHKSEHDLIASEIVGLKQRLMEGSINLSEQTYLKFTDVLNTHIKSSDKFLSTAIR